MHNSAQLRCFENGNDDFGVEAFWIGDAARVGYFVPLNGPLNGHPPSMIISLRLHKTNMNYLYNIILISISAINYVTGQFHIGELTWLGN